MFPFPKDGNSTFFKIYFPFLFYITVSSSSSGGLLPCAYRGYILFHSDERVIDECTTCSCDNGTVRCNIRSCQPTFCHEPLTDPEECCDFCPFCKFGLIENLKISV